MNLIDWIFGFAEAELVSADFMAAIARLNQCEIPIGHIVQTDPLTGTIQIRRRDFDRMRQNRENFILRVRHVYGLYYRIQQLRERLLLLAGIFILLAATIYLPSRVLFVRVDGNHIIPTRQILSSAEAAGVRFGADRALVRSETVKNQIIADIPELKWVGINTSGCTALISVSENNELQSADTTQAGIHSVVAICDGIVTQCDVTAGTAVVHTGQAVRKGELLISPYTDCSFCVRIQSADGEVYAQTVHTVSSCALRTYRQKQSESGTRRNISILIGKKRIFLWNYSRNWNGTCGRMYEEYYVTLPGGFRLPLGISVDRVTYYNCTDSVLSEEYAQELLQTSSDQYLLQQLSAGRILQSSRTVTELDGALCCRSDYRCTEMIGRSRPEQIGAEHGKTD